jgi:enoyl-CoA hydratase
LIAGFLAVFDYPAPVVAAVNGHALAGGCVMAMAAHVRYMSAGTVGVREIAVGVPFPVSAIEICRQVMGTRMTAAALGGQAVTPQQASRLGWVDAIGEPDELLGDAVARARQLGTRPPDTCAFTKRQLHRPTHTAIMNDTAEDREVASTWRSDVTRARIAAFVANLGS